MTKTFLLIDAHAIIYRAYHAFPPLSNPAGELVNAVYGFTRILLKAIADFEPEYLAVSFDSKEKTKRKESYEAYKAQRAKMPDDLIPQISLVKKVVDVLGIPRYEIPGFEADDLIGTLAKKIDQNARLAKSVMTIIVTGDKDLFQLVDANTHVFLPARGKNVAAREYDTIEVQKKMGVTPAQIVDLKSLMGDASDNIPGVRGVGPKTAVALIQKFASLKGVYDRLDEMSKTGEADELIKGSLLDKLMASKKQAELSFDLAKIDTQAPLELDLAKCQVSGYSKAEAGKFFEELGFKSLMRQLPDDEFETGVQEALF